MSHVFRGAIAALFPNVFLGCAVGDELSDEAIQKAAVRDQILGSASVTATMEMQPGGNLLDLPTRPNGMPGGSSTTTASATPPGTNSSSGMPLQPPAGMAMETSGLGTGGAGGTMTGTMPSATSSAAAMPTAPPPGGGFFGGMMMASPDELLPAVLIDDLEDGDAFISAVEGRNGLWFSFSDGHGEQKFSIDPECNRAPPVSVACAHSSASAFPEYAGIGFSFHEDGTPVDASRHRGIRFLAKSATPVELTVSLLTAESVAAEGSPGFETTLDVGGDWAQLAITFDQLEPSSWYEGTPLDFDASELVEVQIHTGGVAHELFVDDVEFH